MISVTESHCTDIFSYITLYCNSNVPVTTALPSDTTVTAQKYKSSSVTIASVTLEDKGTYVATVTVSDLTGNQMLTKTFTTVVAIKGGFFSACEIVSVQIFVVIITVLMTKLFL